MNKMKLFNKAYIGNLKLSNRIIMAPMGTKSDPDGGFCQRDIDYFTERAKGGVGMIITGRVAVSTKYEMRSHHVLDNYHQVNRLAMLCEKVHHYGTALCVQIGPGLGRMVHQDPFTPPYSASAVPSHYYPELICKPLSKEDIKYLAEATGFSASLAKRAGADAVELHAYGGYLLDQFMSELYNKRTDEYGNDFNGRMKFTLECIREIQKQCGKDFPLIVKFTANQACEGGRTIDEGIKIARLLQSAGVHALHIDQGCFECWHKQIPTVYGKAALQLDDTSAVKAAVTIPVIGHGKLNDPAIAESALYNRKLDFVALGHQMMADPYWAAKVKNNQENDIVPCIGCNECLFASHQGKDHSCAVNPQCLRESDYPLPPVNKKTNILIIGGGPAGMSAAITAAKRNIKVELWEKSDTLGGNLNSAGAPEFKKDVLKYRDYLVNKLYSLNITVKLNKEILTSNIINSKYDKVILALGAEPFIPPIPGSGCSHVSTAISALKSNEKIDGNVIVIGGGLVGCETALHLQDKASSVTLIETMDDILITTEHCQNNDSALREMMSESDIKIITRSKVCKITENNVEICHEDNSIETIPCAKVVIAAGFKTDDKLINTLDSALGDALVIIGDAKSPRKIYSAVHEGFHAARLI